MTKIENTGLEAYEFNNVKAQTIIRLGHPTLRSTATDFKDPTSDEARLVAQKLLATVDDYGPVAGLAAPQINILKRAFIFQVPPHRAKEYEPIPMTVVINPIIEPIGNDTQSSWEGCLSAPDLLAFVERPTTVKYSYYDYHGKLITGIATGFHANVLQHEYDHLNGVMHIDHIQNPDDIGYIDEIKAFRF